MGKKRNKSSSYSRNGGLCLKCDLCGQSVRGDYIHQHTFICHEKLHFGHGLYKPKSIIKCSECGESVLASAYALHLHQHKFDSYVKSKPSLKCRLCDIFLMAENQRELHEKIHTINNKSVKNLTDPYKCQYCHRPFENKFYTLHHEPGCPSNPYKGKRKPTDDNQTGQDAPDATTRKKSLPQRSMPWSAPRWKIKKIDRWGKEVTCFRNARNEIHYKCDLCGKIRPNSELYHHLYVCHQKVMFGNCSIQPTSMVTCTFCDYPVFASKYALHVQRHRWLLYPRVPPLQCTKCKLTFATRGQLDFHKNIHDLNSDSIEQDNPFQCQLCDKTFKTIAAKLAHLKSCESEPKKQRYNKRIKPKKDKSRISRLATHRPEILPTFEDNLQIEGNEGTNKIKVVTRNKIRQSFINSRNCLYPCGRCDFLSSKTNVGHRKLIKHCTLFHGVTFKKVKQAQVATNRSNTRRYFCYVCGHLFYSVAFARCHVEYCELVNGLTTANTGALKNIPMLKHV